MAAVQTYVRVDPPGEDPARLLDPDEQQSEPWSGTVYGKCDKCDGSGKTTHECESCKEERDDGCPKCGGEVRYEGDCPVCEGSGEIDDSCRDGVSVFPDEDGLYRYMLKRDADEGALLVRPKRIVDTRPLDRERIGELRRQLGSGTF